MLDHPDVAVQAALFSAEECAAIIALAEAEAAAQGSLRDGMVRDQVRRSRIRWLPDGDAASWVETRLLRFAAAAMRERFPFDLDGFEEHLQVAEYRADDQGTYDWHSDRGWTGLAGRRKLTLVVQLTPPAHYAGGALELNPGGEVLTASPAIGDAVAFPSFVLHRVAPVTEGVRHSLAAWMHGAPFR